MERAGSAIAEQAMGIFGSKRRILVLCGKGNNGGDGLVTARYLHLRGYSVRCLVLASEANLSPDAASQFEAAKERGVSLALLSADDFRSTHLDGFDALVDALFGTGLSSAVRNPFPRVIDIVNGFRGTVVSADLPSGLSGSTAEIPGAVVQANQTVAIQALKLPHVLMPAAACCGRVQVVEIGIELPEHPAPFSVITAGDALSAFPARKAESHKGTFGRLLLVSGSSRMPGALGLAASGALMGGAGYLVAASVQDALALLPADLVRVPLPTDVDGFIAKEDVPVVVKAATAATAILTGPGLGRTDSARAMIEALLDTNGIPLVIDADGLNAISDGKMMDTLRARTGTTVLTPHPGEFRRLIPVRGSRLDQARLLAKESGCTVVLKGHRTIVAEPSQRAAICLAGGPALARAGSGDVLAGLLASILARGQEPFAAASAAVYLHALAGDLLAEERGDQMVPAGALAGALPFALEEAGRRAGETVQRAGETNDPAIC